MDAKRIICLVLIAVLLLGLIGGAISVMSFAAESETTAPGETAPEETGGQIKNGDKIVFFILGILVPVAVFVLIIIKGSKGRN